MSDRRIMLALALATVATGVAFALYTEHVWEDYYITYQASRNLALGHAFGFDPTQRVHTFTSPIQGLVPAILYATTAGGDDARVLWQFRLLSFAFLAGVAALSFALVRERLGRVAGVLVALLIVTEIKTLDFTVNGQEPSYWIFFHLLGLWALCARPNPSWVWLGLAWGGAMWARPDSFLYIAAALLFVGVGVLRGATPFDLPAFARIVAKAAGLATLVYGPWFFGAWLYYGTPIPHPVVAKGLGNPNFELDRMLENLLRMPWVVLRGGSAADFLYAPIYVHLGGWPEWIGAVSRGLAAVAGGYWLVWRGDPLGRACSFVCFVCLYYLVFLAGFAFPWYFPLCAALGVIAVAFAARDLGAAASRLGARVSGRGLARGALATLLLASLVQTGISARTLKLQQEIIESGHRAQIGRWLAEHARSPRDTVVLESLGYIGFFSGLKTYDFPGLSSPEMVAARERHGDRMRDVIADLQPDWVVVRPTAAGLIGADTTLPGYERVAVFDASERVAGIEWLPGRGYLEYDARYHVLARTPREADGALD